MNLTLEYVESILAPDEPDYEAARGLSRDAVPLLIQLLHSTDIHFATKATSLLGIIGGPQAADVIASLVEDPRITVRIAAVATIGNLSLEQQEAILPRFLASDDAIVRKLALDSTSLHPSQVLHEIVGRIAEHDSVPELQEMARQMLMN